MAEPEVTCSSSFCCCRCLLQNKVSKIHQYFVVVFFFQLALVGYGMILPNRALRASLAIYHLISNAVRSWKNCLNKQYHTNATFSKLNDCTLTKQTARKRYDYRIENRIIMTSIFTYVPGLRGFTSKGEPGVPRCFGKMSTHI